MAGRVGPRMDRGLGLASVERPLRAPKAGSYGSSNRRGDGTGGTTYPTVLEAYNRDSDYKRWRAGLDYWQGSGKSWGDLQRFYLVRPFRDYGTAPGPQMMSATLFPTGLSPESNWTVVTRQRGALILPEPLRDDRISYDLSISRPDQHRLVLDVGGILSESQLQDWQSLIGDQFEDSAIAGADGALSIPSALAPNPIESVAYTLVDVDVEGARLLFDLSRPYVKKRPNPLKPRSFWQRVGYDGRSPIPWRGDGTRLLCSSHRFYCNCPDFSGSRIADLIGDSNEGQSRFPRPGAGRSIGGRWESEAVGYRSRWRDLPDRADKRRECKHIHAVRWSLNCAFYEPSDYEVGSAGGAFIRAESAGLSASEVLRYHGRREITIDMLASSLADSSRVKIDAGNTVSPDELAPVQPGRQPVLWATQREPAAYRCRSDDWWLQPGTKVLRVFDPTVQRFVKVRQDGETFVPVIQELVNGQLPESLLQPDIESGGELYWQSMAEQLYSWKEISYVDWWAQ
jgi:hypothetical protein